MNDATDTASSHSGDRPTGSESGASPLLAVQGLEKHFPVNSGFIDSLSLGGSGMVPVTIDDSVVKAVDGVNFELHRGETFGVVGESGCGKSTLARTLLGLAEPTDGTIRFDGADVTELTADQADWFRENVQMVFQDPQSSLNPRRTAGRIIADPLEGAGWEKAERSKRALELLEDVGLKRDYYNRYPHEFSGGQRQRINLARALSVNPDLVVADEPVSGLDMSVQAQILELMNDLQDQYGLTYLIITHDLGVVRNIADRVAVMYVGDFVEMGPSERLFSDPHHPYTRELLGAVPNPDPDAPPVKSRLTGDIPSPENPPTGCKFHTRCPKVIHPQEWTRTEYHRFAEFRQAILAGDVDGETQSEIVDAYFDGSIPEHAAESIEAAATQLANGRRDAAIESLDGHETECLATTPEAKSITEQNHVSACHLDVDGREQFAR